MLHITSVRKVSMGLIGRWDLHPRLISLLGDITADGQGSGCENAMRIRYGNSI